MIVGFLLVSVAVAHYDLPKIHHSPDPARRISVRSTSSLLRRDGDVDAWSSSRARPRGRDVALDSLIEDSTKQEPTVRQTHPYSAHTGDAWVSEVFDTPAKRHGVMRTTTLAPYAAEGPVAAGDVDRADYVSNQHHHQPLGESPSSSEQPSVHDEDKSPTANTVDTAAVSRQGFDAQPGVRAIGYLYFNCSSPNIFAKLPQVRPVLRDTIARAVDVAERNIAILEIDAVRASSLMERVDPQGDVDDGSMIYNVRVEYEILVPDKTKPLTGRQLHSGMRTNLHDFLRDSLRISKATGVDAGTIYDVSVSMPMLMQVRILKNGLEWVSAPGSAVQRGTFAGADVIADTTATTALRLHVLPANEFSAVRRRRHVPAVSNPDEDVNLMHINGTITLNAQRLLSSFDNPGVLSACKMAMANALTWSAEAISVDFKLEPFNQANNVQGTLSYSIVLDGTGNEQALSETIQERLSSQFQHQLEVVLASIGMSWTLESIAVGPPRVSSLKPRFDPVEVREAVSIRDLNAVHCVTVANVSAFQRADVDFWKTHCQIIPDGAFYVRMVMGSVTDYFKPKENASYCDMLVSGGLHQWSPNGKTWMTPDSSGMKLFGGSSRNWPHAVGDQRTYLSSWGSSVHPGGCCQGKEAGDGDAAWSQSFTMEYCRNPMMDRYASTLRAIGCPNVVPKTSMWWNETDEDALEAMFQMCQSVQEGFDPEGDLQQLRRRCCGQSRQCMPECSKQITFQEEFTMAERVKVQDKDTSQWKYGKVTSLAPLKVKPDGWEEDDRWLIVKKLI